MTHTLTIEAKNEADFALVKELAERLGLSTKETHQKRLSKAESLALLDKVAGSWEGPETGDEINEMIRNSRLSGNRDVEL
ncbi:hypothetical protein [Dyadobacter arcticus]|uniref:Asparagine synthetase B (Glutamine-hydrolysing) n=1 Tax=Dyadobacter arcticus TaxID=1078754 RepID=A0ABX0US66_9BACT|nr:hypothetical protein [Dyadobacter arcticus]NIJ55258.1 asparagine synthetase B (glutamine-hydrolysing) [Dyadobacter arcticus]